MVDRSVHDFDGIRIDTRDWPLVLMEMPAHPVPDTSVHQALWYLERLMKRTPPDERFFQVTDLSSMRDVAPARQRKYSAEWAKRTAPFARHCRIGGAIVAKSSLLRGMLTAVFWLAKPEGPTHVVSTRREGLLCAIHALEATGPLPAHLSQLRDRLLAPPRRTAAAATI
ncbi:MAG: hypothetical protein ACRENE_29120 [Polyangiaceae bacterium]